MTKYKQSPIKTPQGMMLMHAPYFDQLLRANSPEGRLTREAECHALWYYFALASKAHAEAKANFVLEEDRSRVFNRDTARQLFTGVANMYQVRPGDMVKFWPIVQQQRIAIDPTGQDHLPDEFKFMYWGH